jgi:PAS domain S-box-containing protein
MRPAQIPTRLFAEILAIVGSVVAALGALLPTLAPLPQLPALLGALLVVLLAAPPIYWRCMHAVRQAALPAAAPPVPVAVPVERLEQRRLRAILATALAHLCGVALTALAGWYVHAQVGAAPAADAALARASLAAVVVGGALLSMLLALVVWALSSARIRAQTFAERMTADLDRLAQVVKHTDNAVMITDAAMRITWVNEGFTRITGYAQEEATGHTPGELLGSGKADPQVLQRLADCAARAEPCRVEILNRTKDGREYWTDTEVQPLHDANGALTGFMEIGRDITEQRRAAERLEAALRENAALMAMIDQHALVAVCDHDGRISHVNDAFCRVSGYARDELIGRSHRFVDGGVEERSFWAPVWAAAAAGRAWRGEVRNRAKDGTLYWVDTTIAPLLDAEGRPDRFITIRGDITASKQAAAELALERERLQKANTLLQAILDNLPCGLSVFDAQMNLLVATPQFRTLLDLPDALFEPAPVPFERLARFNAERGEYGPGDVEAVVARIVERARQPVAHSFERRRGELTLEIRGSPLPGGGLVTTYTDVTPRKHVEAVLQRAEALLRGAIDAVDEAFVLFDPDDRLVYCNDKYRQMYASSADLLVPGNTFEHIVRTGAERGQYADAIGRVDAWVAERLAAHRGGNISLVQRLDNGRWVRVVERRMADGHIVGFRIDISDLMRANEAAEAASQAKSRFVANMSHEIRTPMNGVLGMLKLLRRTPLDARQLDYAAKAERAALALLGLLNDILDFSKVEAGKLELDPRPFSIDQLLRDLSVVLSGNLGSKPVELLFDIDPHLPALVVGDDLRLRQVLINLAGNALKFTERGEVVVSVRQLARGDALVRLEFAVRDTGIGIAPAQQQHVFSAFSQAEASTTRRFGGTGLGLAICQRLVAVMGGEIRLESEPGRGSRFSFELDLPVPEDTVAVRAAPTPPLRMPSIADDAAPSAWPSAPASPPAWQVHAPPAASAARLAGLRLLVVEDNLTNQQVAEELLADEGAIVHLAADGEQGVAAVAAADPPYDAVLMDVQMPVMDGYGAAAAIRHGLGLATLPIIAMTANTMPGDREASLAAGMDDHVSKPFDLDELVAVLLKHVHRQAAARPPAVVPAALTEPVLARAHALGIGLQAALDRLGGKTGVWLRSARSFTQELLQHRGSLQQLLQDGERDDAARLMHTVKGVAALLGADALAAAAAGAELQLRSPIAADTAALVERLGHEIEHARAALQELVTLLDTGDPVPAVRDPVALMALLEALAPLLAGADMAATDLFADLQAAHEEAWGPALQPLADAMARLDFEAALTACQALRERLAATTA